MKIDDLNINLWSLFDSMKPWILVDNGSILGYFDWVPARLRVGPWQPYAPVVLALFTFATPILVNWLVDEKTYLPTPHFNEDAYPEYLSAWWFYNLFCFVWITGISLTVLRGPAGIRAWATYSMWTWTILHLRHGLVVVSPWLKRSNFILVSVLELSRFPMLLMCTMTFVVWNFILMPVIYFFFMDDERKRKTFLSYFTSFRLTQIHVFNLLFAYVNGVIVSPQRLLNFSDFLTCWTITVLYIMWYLLVLDRVGVHLYPIFSPRNPWMIAVWILLVAAHVAGFFAWDSILKPVEIGLDANRY